MSEPKITQNADGTTTVTTDHCTITATHITEIHTGPVVIDGDFTAFRKRS